MPDAAPARARQLRVPSEDLHLAVWRIGESGPPVVFIHGYPDTHAVWDLVVDMLAGLFRCVAYDVRGAGASGAPRRQEGYRLSHLTSDLVAILDSQFPGEPVHLVAHDWGSIQAWDAVVRESSDSRLRGRIASYTTISGPCLQHADAYVSAALHGGWQRRREALRQLRHSWYVYAFHVPLLPDLALRRYAEAVMRRADPARQRFAPTLPTDAVNGLELYRANIFSHDPVPGGPRTSLPVQLVVPLRDAFITESFTRDVGRFAPHLTRVEIDAGHWVPISHPDELAAHITTFTAKRQ
jgi:pimeloyl-ACP methyl ester carboxylesterase